MKVFDPILKRKSVRSYTGEAPSESEMLAIMAAAQAAPIGMKDYDSVKITVIKNPDMLRKIDENARAMFKADSSVLYGAPVLVVVSSKLTKTPRDNVAYSNGACIVENIAIAAAAIRLGACHIWGAVMALSQNAQLVGELGLPEGYTPICGIVLGKTKEPFADRIGIVVKNKIEVNEI